MGEVRSGKGKGKEKNGFLIPPAQDWVKRSPYHRGRGYIKGWEIPHHRGG